MQAMKLLKFLELVFVEKKMLLKKIQKSTASLALLIELSKDVTQQKKIISQQEKDIFFKSGITKYKQILRNLSKTVHPFDINNLNRQTSISVELLLNQLVVEIKALQKEQEIKDSKNVLKNLSNKLKV